MYKLKENMLPPVIEKMFLEGTKRHGKNTRISEPKKVYINHGLLKEGNTLFKMIDYWNNSNIEIKSKTFPLTNVKKRINYFFRQKNQQECEKIRCKSCNAYDEEKLIKYMKF